MRRRAAVVLVAALAAAGCSDGGGSAATTTTAASPAPASTTAAPTTVQPDASSASEPPASVPVAAAPLVPVGTLEVSAAYRQGVARVDDGWIFTTNKAIYRVDESYERTVEALDAIPADLAADGFDHLGDGDVADGVLHVPLEQPDYDAHDQRIVRYDASSLEVLGWDRVDQAHAAWLSVDGDVLWSMSGFTDDVVLRYELPDLTPIEPLRLDATVERVQGGDVGPDGALWLTTDDEIDGIYRVDLATGHVELAGGLEPVDGEGEGVDVTDLPSGLVHALSIDPSQSPAWFQHLRAES